MSTIDIPELDSLEADYVVYLRADMVIPDMPAGLAGLEAGDRLLTVDGEPVNDVAALQESLAGKSRMTLGIARGGLERTFTVDLSPGR